MESEILAVPEDSLEEFIKVVRAGLDAVDVSAATKEALTEWCDQKEEYLNELEELAEDLCRWEANGGGDD